MFKNFRDKMTLSGIAVLSIGVALLIFTFVSAYEFLAQSPTIDTSADLTRTFGDSLAPLIATCIRLMYLGIMGWVASLMTIRGVTIIIHAPQLLPLIPQQSSMEQSPLPQTQLQKPKREETKEEKPKQPEEPQEPEIVVIPPEAIPEPEVSNA